MGKKEIEHFNETVKSVLTENNLFVTQKYLYHYTDIYGLEGIIKNKELWLSERNYMNDINDEKAKKYFYRGNIEEALALINSADVVVGSRFHANILGIVYDKVVIPLAYSDKTIDALTDISFNGRIYDLRKNEKIILKDEDLIYKKNMFDDKSVNIHFEKLDNYLRRK